MSNLGITSTNDTPNGEKCKLFNFILVKAVPFKLPFNLTEIHIILIHANKLNLIHRVHALLWFNYKN